MVNAQAKGTPPKWHKLSGAELKAWVASVLLWCCFKSIAFPQFKEGKLDPNRATRWFSSFYHWQQIKRSFKISDPDTEDATDKLCKVRGLWDFIWQPAEQICGQQKKLH